MSELDLPSTIALRPAPRAGPAALPDPTAKLQRDDPEGLVHAAFLARARSTPDAIAMSSAFGLCTYGELAEISSALARVLVARGIGPGTTVAILATRGPALIYGMLGVLRSGAAFQILDAAYPTARILACVAQAAPSLLLVAAATPPPELSASFAGGHQIELPSGVQEARERLGKLASYVAPSVRPRDLELQPRQLAYVSFTSGSTGAPKGILTAHAPLPHFIGWHAGHGGMSARDRVSMLSGLSHDPMLRDVFTPLSLGATLHIPSQATLFDADALWEWFIEQEISVTHMTPAIGDILTLGAPEGGRLTHLRRVYWGGDVLSPQLSQRISALAPHAVQTNFYGATETPQAMAYYDLDAQKPVEDVAPLGRGIAGAQLLVVDDRGQLCKVDQEGEIWIRSPYLSLGYLNDPEQTRARFVRSPFSDDPDDFCYRTGDLGRYRQDGEVMFGGRADHQLKIRGFRVEPAEIVRALEQLPHVRRALVLARELHGARQLVAYLVFEPGREMPVQALRVALERTLPSYMVPKFFVGLPALPLLPNGKIDLQALPEPAQDSLGHGSKRMPSSDAERALAAIWADILGIDDIGVDESFLDLGGDSLSAIRALTRMRRLGIPEDVARGIFQGRTIAELTGPRPPTGSTVRPLAGAAKTALSINVLRGLLVLLLVFDHWREGIFKRLDIPLSVTNAIELLFHLPTPGFAFVFGMGLGYTHYDNYLRNPKASRRLLQGGALLLAVGTLFMGVSRNLGVLARGEALDYDRISTNFFLPTLYYCMALATAPLWFALMKRRERKWGGGLLASLLLAAACRGLYELCRLLLLEPEREGLLQLGRLMLTARFSYFNLSTGALIGIFFGLYVRRERARPHLIPQLATCGALILSLGYGLYRLQRERYPEALMSADIWLPEWLFFLGATLLLGALVEVLLLASRVLPIRSTLEWTAVVGQCAMPIFILQGVVFDVTAFGRAFGLRDGPAVALALAGFALAIGWMMWRVHGLYYGRVPERLVEGEQLASAV